MKAERRLRVLMVVTSLEPTQGGIASVNRSVVRALQGWAEARPAVQVLAYHGASNCAGDDHAGRPIRVQGCRSKRLVFVLRYLLACWSWKPDLVFIDHLHLAAVAYLCRLLGGREYVLFCHGTEFDGALSRLRQAAFRGAALRLSNSHFTARRLRGLFPGAAIEPCELGREEGNGACPKEDAIGELPDVNGVPRALADAIVLIVSRLNAGERYKGHDQLIGVMPKLRAAVPETQLVIVGDGDDRERLRTLAQASGAGESILFAGFVNRSLLTQLYARCRVFAMPSRKEGFGLVYLEAMQHGKACVASRVDGGSEVVLDGETGFLVDPDEPGELQQALERLLTDPGLAVALGEAGRKRLHGYYEPAHFQERLVNRLRPLVEAKLEAVSGAGAALPPVSAT